MRAGAGRYGAAARAPARRAGRSSPPSPGRCRSACTASAILLLVRDANGSFAVAGRVVGAFGLANALGAVAQGRLMDRFGQSRVLRRAGAMHFLMLLALVVAALRGAPSWALAPVRARRRRSLPQVPAAMRSLWSALVEEETARQTAYALVTIVFEVSVVTAPVVTAAIAALASPAAAVVTAGAIGLTGALGFSATAASRRWRGVRPRRRPARAAARRRGADAVGRPGRVRHRDRRAAGRAARVRRRPRRRRGRRLLPRRDLGREPVRRRRLRRAVVAGIAAAPPRRLPAVDRDRLPARRGRRPPRRRSPPRRSRSASCSRRRRSSARRSSTASPRPAP